MSKLASLVDMPGVSMEAVDDFEDINALYIERGWSDGLPIVPPTEERVERMLAYCDRPWDEPVARIAPRFAEATPLRLAANAVMAGCLPSYFPLVMLAIEALCEEPFNLNSIQTTTHPCTPLVIVNGPVAMELGLNSGHNAFGSGTRSNATIGRAIRLALVNIGGASTMRGDMSTMGSPAKYSYCVAENEAANPWQPLHVERGFPAAASAVTVVGAECPHNVNDHGSITAQGILTTTAGTIISTGANDVYYVAPQPVVVFCPEHAATIAADGYSKDDVKRYLYEHARLPLGNFSKENIERRFRVYFKDTYATAGLDTMIPMFKRAEDILVLVVGGAGKQSAFIPTFGGTRSVTRALKRRDGRFAHSVEEFRGP